MLQALDFSLQAPRRVVVAGDAARPDARALVHAVYSVYAPNKVVLGTAGAVEPFAKTLSVKTGAVAYVCTGTECKPPTSNAVEIRKLLK
jgi:uncharacterized protein YyaL (SSP411 family)